MKRNWRLAALLAAACMLAAALTGCSKPETNRQTEETDAGTPVHSGTKLDALEDIRTADSYEELYRLLTDARVQQTEHWQSSEVPTDDAETSDEHYSSMTNIQVDGYDEGDTVKTDGTYLYILGSADLKIVEADAENPTLVSTTIVAGSAGAESYETANALYLSDEAVAVVITSSESFETSGDVVSYVDQCHVKLYDVSDPTAPVLMGDLAQDGVYQDSRLTDGVVYVVSTENKFAPEETDEASYIPYVWEEETASQIPLDSIYICPDTGTSAYSIVSSVDTAQASRTDVCAFTGGSDLVYMDDTGLYLARTIQRGAESEPYTKNQYTVVDVERVIQTEIKKISTAGGTLKLEQQAYLDGAVSDQYAMDVYEGNLRVATTSDSESYQVFTDETYGWSNYLEGESSGGNNVFVLDAEFNQIGAVTGFAQDEQIYSVRFLAESAYVVTYEQTDPLFTIDLSDPAAPEIMDSLEVSGVSDYLHMYGDGLLFGLGLSDNFSLQAVMFDVSDPENIRVLSQLELPDYGWSEALYNHRAILVSAENGLIAFPAEGSYVVLSSTDGELAVRSSFAFSSYSDGTRGVILDNTMYICDPQAVAAVSLDTMEAVVTEFGVG